MRIPDSAWNRTRASHTQVIEMKAESGILGLEIARLSARHQLAMRSLADPLVWIPSKF